MKFKPLQIWYEKASADQKKEFMCLSGISHPHLHQMAYNKRPIRAEYAILIEDASRKLNKKYPELPIITQPSICNTCSECPYTK